MSANVYDGVSGHGKGLVDAMSGFGVKSPWRRVVITSNFSYGNSLDIYNYFTETFSNDDKKHHFFVDPETIAKRREHKQPLPIKLHREKHMISFSPDGSVQTKINICLCEKCLKGAFIKCSNEAGKNIYFNDYSEYEDSEESDSDDEAKNDTCESVTKENEIKAECVIDVVNPGSYVALYSSPNPFEMGFFVSYIADTGVTPEIIIEKGSIYLKCNYLEKKSEKKKGNIFYKMLKKIVYVLPAQVVNPFVSLNDDLSMSAADYQWLADSI